MSICGGDVEIWKDIPNFEGYYQASSFGRIKSVSRIVPRFGKGLPIKEKIMKGVLNHKGYLLVNLRKNGICIGKAIHRWVALTFLPNKNNLSEVNHIDGNKLNNKLSNLEWCTPSYNSKHAYNIGLKDKKGIKNYWAQLSEENVKEILSFYMENPKAKLNIYAKKFGVTEQLIWRIRNRKSWTHITL